MSQISTPLELNQHLFSFIKERFNGTGSSDDSIATDFRAWVLSRNNTLSPAMDNRLKSYTVCKVTEVGADFTTFVKANLPLESESTRDFALRYQWDCLGRALLLSEAAYRAIVTQLKLLGSAAAPVAFKTWLTGKGSAAPDTFLAQLNAYRNDLAAQVTVLTSGAVHAIAESCGHSSDYDGAVVSMMGAVKADTNKNYYLPKAEEGAACWNWALSALGTTDPTPSEVVDWLHSPADSQLPASLANANGSTAAVVKELTEIKELMLVNRLSTMDNGYDANWASVARKVTVTEQLTARMIRALVALNGFTIVDASTTKYAVCAEYKIADGVSWEHWWVELNGTVVETFPKQMFILNMTGLRQVDRMGVDQRATYRVVTVPVKELLPGHYRRIRYGLAQHLGSS